MEETTNNSKRRVESLGWLTESALFPKKQKAIEGVGASSIVELRAQLYRTQEEAKRAKEAAPDADLHRARRKPLPNDSFSHKNAGVDARDHRDKLHLKSIKDGSASYAALEKKAELYSKLVRGELLDEEEEEKYCVDFLSKSVSEHNLQQLEGDNKERVTDGDIRIDDNVSMSYSDGKRAGLGWTGHIGVGEEHKRLVREVNEETNEARVKASGLKQRRQMQAEKNREKLRQAFLKKQIEKLKAAKAAENTQLPDSSCADGQSGIGDVNN